MTTSDEGGKASEGGKADRPHATRWLLAATMVLAVLVRLAYCFVVSNQRLTDDETSFWAVAGNLAEGRGFTFGGEATAWRPPTYAFLLAALRWLGSGVAGVQVVQTLLGATVVPLLYLCVRRLALPLWVALLAGVAGALYPPFVHFSSQMLSENLSVPTLLVAVWATLVVLERPTVAAAAWSGVAWGLAILTRPAALAALVVAAAATALGSPQRQRIVAGLSIVVVAAGVLAPWVVRNARVVGGPVPVVSNEGFTLWVANRLDTEGLKDVFRDPDYPGLEDYGVYGRQFPGIEALAVADGFDFSMADEAERDRWFRRRVAADVRADPERFVERVVAKTALALAPAPGNASREERTGTAATLVLWSTSGPLMVVGWAGLLLAARSRRGAFLAAAGVLSLVGVATHLPYVRYRVGAVDPLLILGAASALSRLWPRRPPASSDAPRHYDAVVPTVDVS